MKKQTYKVDGEPVTGVVLYEGRSLLVNNQWIVVILTFNSSNIKTGNMMQFTYLLRDVPPIEAVKSGMDEANCGDCNGRKTKDGWCYVNLGHSPRAIWKAYNEGKYPMMEGNKRFLANVVQDRSVRDGNYGDPASAPQWVTEILMAGANHNTGYTHQWKSLLNTKPSGLPVNNSRKDYLMASCDSKEDKQLAIANGWRTFRMTHDLDDIDDDEVICPNYTHKVQCENCVLCSGNKVQGKNVVAPVHGACKSKFVEEVK